MIERLAEPVAANVLEAATEDQTVFNPLPTAERPEDQLPTVLSQRLGAGKPNPVGTLDLDLVRYDRIVHNSFERNLERLPRSGKNPAHVPTSLQERLHDGGEAAEDLGKDAAAGPNLKTVEPSRNQCRLVRRARPDVLLDAPRFHENG